MGGRCDQLRSKFNSGEINPEKHIGQVKDVVEANNKTVEATFGYNEVQFDYVMSQNKNTSKGPIEVDSKILQQLRNDMERRPQINNNQLDD